VLAKILVPLDGSEYSFKALDYAITLGRKFSSTIYVIHIVQLVHTATAMTYDTAFMTRGIYTLAPDVIGPTFLIDLKKHLEENGRQILAITEARIQEAGLTAVTTLLYGSPAEEIVAFAEKAAMDLIVMGDRGLGAVTRFFLGSVSTNVSRHASCPVLIVKT